jgi:TolA-binding protein
MFGITRGRLVGGIALVAALGVALGLAFADDNDADEPVEKTVQTGTYQPQMVFEQYYRTQQLMEFLHELQGEAEVAQREGNQQKMMELQMRFQQREREVMEAFMERIEGVVTEVAEEEKVDVVALEIQYKAPHVGDPTDLTQQIVAKLNKDAPKTEADADNDDQ